MERFGIKVGTLKPNSNPTWRSSMPLMAKFVMEFWESSKKLITLDWSLMVV